MTEQPVVVQKISWAELCPWTIIFRTLPIATSITVLVFALLGVLLTPIGWLLSETMFLHEAQRSDQVLMERARLNSSPYRSVFVEPDAITGDGTISLLGTNFSGPQLVFQHLVQPFQLLFNGHWRGWEFCYFLLGGVWSVLVWSFVGIGIARVCLLRLTRNEHFGLDDAFEFAISKWLTAAGAVGIPLAAIAVLCLPTFLLGLFMGFDLGVVLVGFLWFVVLAIAIAMAVLLLGLMFGWPLMVASVAAESQNSFDAMTRSYAYTFQRPLHYVFYMLIAILFGGFCWIVVAAMTNGVVGLAFWSTSWGTGVYGADRIEVIKGFAPDSPFLEGTEIIPATQTVPQVTQPMIQPMIQPATQPAIGQGAETAEVLPVIETNPAEVSGSMATGRSLIGLWNVFIKTLAAAFIYGLFWCQASAIYLLLRKDVDETEMDEIFVADEKRTYELPPLKSDAQGIPQVQSLVAVDEGEESE